MTRGGVVLAGGRSSRMGQPKQALLADGRTLVQGAVDACLDAGCALVVVVAPPVEASGWVMSDERVVVTLEDPPLGGPVAGIAAGLALVEQCDEVLLFACDLPGVAAVARALVAVELEGGADAVVPVDSEGWPQWLAARYRTSALVVALAGQPTRDVSVNRALRGLRRQDIALDDACLADVDTPEDAGRAGLSGLAESNPA